MEVEESHDGNLILRRIDIQNTLNSTGLKLDESFDFLRSDTIDVLQVIEWWPYVGVWLLIKEIHVSKIKELSLKVKCPDNSIEPVMISAIQADTVLSESLELKNYQVWFGLLLTSFPFTLEMNVRENINYDNAVSMNLVSTSHEMFFRSHENQIGRKTFFEINQPHIICDDYDFGELIQIERCIYFFIALGYYWKAMPMDMNIRSIIVGCVTSSKKFCTEYALPWNVAEFITEHQTHIFIPPIQDVSRLFGKTVKYKGILIMSKDSNTVEEVLRIFNKAIDDYEC